MPYDIDSPYSLTEASIRSFQANGFVKLKDVLSPESITHYGREITRKVVELNTMHLPMAERTTYQKAFLQIMNLWQQGGDCREFVFGRRLARLAAQLMGTHGVRLYHDQALYKEAGGGFTPWHADQFYWPLASEKCCTVWIPLQRTTLDMGPLAFAARSHRFAVGRDLPISDASEAEIEKALTRQNFPYANEPFDLGEVSFHYGWTFHRADGNTTDTPRHVMTIISMDADMVLKSPENPNQEADWHTWCPGARVGYVIDTPLNPVLYAA